MTILIKRFQRSANGTTADGQQLFDGETLTLGASSDRNIIIEWPGVQLRHATATLKNQQLHVASHSQNGFLVDQETCHEATLESGQSFQIGNHEFSFTLEDGQAVLNLTVDELAPLPSNANPKTRLEHIGFSKRRWSLGLLGFIVLVFLVSPLINRAVQNHGESPVIHYILPSDSSWNTGSFHPAHQFFANDCSTCHTQPFAQTKDETCMSCHQESARHFPVALVDQNEHPEAACQSCHKEHNGQSELVVDDKKLCVNCHKDIHELTNGQSEQVSVQDWEKSHPEITLNMAYWDTAAEQWHYRQHKASEPAKEQSGLLFPHDVHLAAEGFDTGAAEAKVLVCADCHTPEPGGALMQPVNMEQHCESCHRLDFDPARPSLTVRHGDIAATLRDIAGLKGLDALFPPPEHETQVRPPVVSNLVRPGKTAKSATYIKQASTLTGIAEELIEKRGCATCHTVNKDEQALKEGRLLQTWSIEPVHLTQRWIDDAEFDHSGHRSISCLSCHSAIESSESSEDVHIPARSSCLECHGNPNSDGLSVSQCIDCHSYHLPEHGLLSPSGQTPSVGAE